MTTNELPPSDVIIREAEFFLAQERRMQRARKRKDLLETLCGAVLFIGLIAVALVSVIGVPVLIVKLIMAFIGK